MAAGTGTAGRKVAKSPKVAGRKAKAAVQVNFSVTYDTVVGQEVRLVGSHPSLGSWDAKRAPALQWSAGNVWRAQIELPGPNLFEYKYALTDSAGNVLQWQKGNNAVVAISPKDTTLELSDIWAGPAGSTVTSTSAKGGAVSATREQMLSKWVQDVDLMLDSGRSEVRSLQMELAEAKADLAKSNAALKEQVGAAKVEAAAMQQALKTAVEEKETIMAQKEQLMKELEVEKLRANELEKANLQLKGKLKDSSSLFKETLATCQGLLDGMAEEAGVELDLTLPGAVEEEE